MVQFDLGQSGNCSIDQVFYEIRTKFGYSVIQDGALLIAYFTDLAPRQSKERLLLEALVALNGHRSLLNAINLPVEEQNRVLKSLVVNLNSQRGIAIDVAADFCNDFFRGIGGTALYVGSSVFGSDQSWRRPINSNPDIQKQTKDRDVLYQDIANNDDQIVAISFKRNASQDECDRIIRLCVTQKKNLKKCQRQGLAVPTLNCSNLDGLMARYKHYLDMLLLDSEIVVGQNDYSRITSVDVFNELCNKQEKNINRCSQNGWELPNIQVLNPGEIASSVIKNHKKAAQKKRIKKKILKLALISVAVLACIAFGFYKYTYGKICVPFDASYAVGKDKEIIVEELKEAGFTNIVEKENTSGWAKSGLVSRVEIDDRERYHKGYYRKPDSTVVVTYSSNNRVDISPLIDNWKTQQAGDLVRALRRYGLNVMMVKTDSHDKENNRRIAAILIDDTPFTEGECFVSKKAEVVVKYNALKIKVAKPDEYNGKPYSEIVNKLKEQGFSNIVLKRTDNWILIGHSEGEIKSITINGESAFSDNQEFYFDDEIVIVVYTYDGKGCEDITINEDE